MTNSCTCTTKKVLTEHILKLTISSDKDTTIFVLQIHKQFSMVTGAYKPTFYYDVIYAENTNHKWFSDLPTMHWCEASFVTAEYIMKTNLNDNNISSDEKRITYVMNKIVPVYLINADLYSSIYSPLQCVSAFGVM